jgi:hypothetical protein
MYLIEPYRPIIIVPLENYMLMWYCLFYYALNYMTQSKHCYHLSILVFILEIYGLRGTSTANATDIAAMK